MITVNLTAEQAALVLTAIKQEINAGEGTFLSNHNIADLRDAQEELAAALTMAEEGAV